MLQHRFGWLGVALRSGIGEARQQHAKSRALEIWIVKRGGLVGSERPLHKYRHRWIDHVFDYYDLHRGEGVVLALSSGEVLDSAIRYVSQYTIRFESGDLFNKTCFVGAFTKEALDGLAKQDLPKHEIFHQRKKRAGYERQGDLQREAAKCIGAQLQIDLANGWRLQGTLAWVGNYHCEILMDNEAWALVFLHALTDWKILTPAVEREEHEIYAPEWQAWFDRGHDERRPRKKKGKKRPNKSSEKRSDHSKSKEKKESDAQPVSAPPIDLWQELANQTPERVVVNAKLKVVLREAPEPIDLGDIFWIPMKNEPLSVPGKVDLESFGVDLLITKKMWKNTLKRANKTREESDGRDPIHIVEAVVGLREGKFVAVASSIQIVPGKPPKAK